MLYAFGSNGSGQLGVGHKEDLSSPTLTLTGDRETHGQIKQLAAGGNHTVILHDDGTVDATGNNEDGRCGIKDVQQLTSFASVQPPLDSNGQPLIIKRVAASWSTTTILCGDSHLYVCGTGNSGELGLGAGVEHAPNWQIILAFPPQGTSVVHLASSMAHMVAVLSNGDVYGWGKGRKGQLGEPAQDLWSPRKMAGIDFGATRAVCGRDFTLVVGESSTGHFTVLGAGANDRFGIRTNAPANLSSWVDVAASWCSIYALKASGDVVAWGRNDHGQLPPHVIPGMSALAAGSEHCLALTKAGKVLAWGWGEHGNCGSLTGERGDVKGRWNEIDVPGRASKIFAGCATSFIFTDEQVSAG